MLFPSWKIPRQLRSRAHKAQDHVELRLQRSRNSDLVERRAELHHHRRRSGMKERRHARLDAEFLGKWSSRIAGQRAAPQGSWRSFQPAHLCAITSADMNDSTNPD